MTLSPIQGRRLAPAPRWAQQRHAGAHETEAGRIPCFVAGPENELLAAVINRLVEAINACQLTPQSNDDTKLIGGRDAPLAGLPSPIVISGPNGSGKTHLACGLVDLYQAKRGGQGKRGADEAAYFTAADFRREFAAAIDQKTVRDFRRDFRRKRLLVIDDAHRLGNSEHSANELRHTIDAVIEHGGLILLTTNGSLADGSKFARPLLSRLTGGLTLEIAPPGREARRELLQQAATAAGFSLDESALQKLAEGLPPEPPRVLRAALELRRRGTSVGPKAAEQLLSDERPKNSPPLREILRVVARYHRVPMSVLTSATRKQGVVAARAVAIYLARELTPMSYADIGKMLGGRDHTTVMHNYRRIARELPKDRALQSAVEDLKRLLKVG